MIPRLLIAFSAFSVAAIFLSSAANAETFTYEVPFDYGDNGCTVFEDGEYKLAQCYMEESRFNSDPKDPVNPPENLSTDTDDGCAEGLDRDIETNECKTPEDIARDALAACKEDLTCPSGFYEQPDGTVINFDDLIAESQKTPDVLPDEGYYMCANDIALYQGGNQFDVPIEIWIDDDGNKNVRLIDDNSIKTDQFTTMEELAIEACFGQWDLEIREAVDIRTMVPNSEDYAPYHSDVAFGIPAISQDRLNELQNEDAPMVVSIKNIICNGYYSDAYKISYGCDKDAAFENLYDAPELSNVFPDEIASKINQYNNDDGAAMAKQLQKDHITDKLLSLQKQLRALE